LVRTLVTRNLARLAFFLLVITVPQFWFARYPVAEAMTQFLMLTGMYAFVRSRGLTLNAPGTVTGIGFPILSGIAFAEIFLTRADSILLLPPLLIYGLIIIFARQWGRAQWAFYLSLGAVLIHALAHMWAFAPTYIYFQYSHFLRMKNIDKLLPGGLPSADDLLAHPGNYLLMVVALGIISIIALFLLDRVVQVLRRRWGQSLARHLPRYESILRWMGVTAFVALFLFAYFIWSHPTTAYAYVGGQTPDDRSANLIKLGWYLSPFALALALMGGGDGYHVPDKFANEFLESIVLHESGHDWGLRHNYLGSQAYTAAQLRSGLVGMGAGTLAAYALPGELAAAT